MALARPAGQCRAGPGIDLQPRGLAQQHVQIEVDRRRTRLVAHQQPRLFGRAADIGHRAALAPADFDKALELVRRNRHHVTLLGFVAPDCHRRHRIVRGRDGAKIERAAYTAVVQKLRDGVGKSAGTDVVDRCNRIFVAKQPALVDHFLAAPLHFGVGPLNRGKIKRLAGLPGMQA